MCVCLKFRNLLHSLVACGPMCVPYNNFMQMCMECRYSDFVTFRSIISVTYAFHSGILVHVNM